MSRLFAIPTSNYKGTTAGIPSQLGLQRLAAPKVIPVVVPWVQYKSGAANESAGVSVNLVHGNVNALDRVLSVYIDNTDNDIPIYVQFPDTLFTVACPPNAEIWQPVVTNLFSANIYGIGFSAGVTPTTSIFFLNTRVDPFTNAELPNAIALWKASATISGGHTIQNTNFGTPALCDQSKSVLLNPVTPGNFTLFTFGQTTGYAYINALQMNFQIFEAPPVTATGIQLFISYQNTFGTIVTLWEWWCHTQTYPGGIVFPTISGLNLKVELSAPSQFLLACQTGGVGFINSFAALQIGFTTNPT